MTVRLKPHSKSRILNRHPWVYRDELSDSIRSVQPGFPVCLRDEKDRFIAYGIGNPQSQIAFRAWSFNELDSNFYTESYLIQKISASWIMKSKMGFSKSFRVVYSEGDQLSGLIFDRYLTPDGHQIFVFQISSGAFEVLLSTPQSFSEKLISNLNEMGLSLPGIDSTAILIKRSQNFMEVENLKPQKIEVIFNASLNLTECEVLNERWPYKDSVILLSDFIDGQKTGLFLDQSFNIGLMAQSAIQLFKNYKTVKILDLCCYRGAWSSHLSQALKQNQKNQEVEVTLFDQSARALEQAKQSVLGVGATVQVIQGDVMKDVETINSSFDIIISDPPAFAKSKKMASSAKEGYYHLNRKSFSKLNLQGLFIACSCTSVISEHEFSEVLLRSLRTHAEADVVNMLRGGHGFDHTLRNEFPEGRYLKMESYWRQR